VISLKLKMGEMGVMLGIAVFIVLVQILSLYIAPPLTTYNLQAFGNPQSSFNYFAPIFYVAILLAFTAALLLILKYKAGWLIQVIIGLSILSTLVYVFFVLQVLLFPSMNAIIAAAISCVLSIVLTALLLAYPEWYVIDVVGILVAAGASALFGISLNIIPTIILLVLLAVYDFISVYKTKHMIKLAEGVMDLKLPILFVMPRRWGYSFKQAQGLPKEGEREAYFMGLGDAVMPTMLAVSANTFLTAPAIGFINYPALGVMLGTLASYAVLMYVVIKLKKPQAGLPFLCTGAIIGLLLGCLVAGVNPFQSLNFLF
jgi:presenilin-like A22 family membrane protease